MSEASFQYFRDQGVLILTGSKSPFQSEVMRVNVEDHGCGFFSRLISYTPLSFRDLKCKRELLKEIQYFREFISKSTSARSSTSNLENYLSKSIKKLVSNQTAITQAIEGLKNPKYSNLLTLRYLDNYTWDQISDEMYLTCQWVQELHKRALVEFEKQMAA